MSNIIPFVSKNPQKKGRFDILDAWRTVAILLMLVYHFLYDLLIFGVIAPQQMFSPGLNLMQKFICGSFILLAGASARFSRSNLRHGIIVLLAGISVEIGAAVGGQTIRFGILQFMGVSMVLWHFTGKHLQKLPRWLLAAGGAVLYVLTDWWTGQVTVSVSWLYPLGFPNAAFTSADYFPLLPWFFLFLMGAALGGWCLDHQENKILTAPLPGVLTFPGRHSLIIYLLHQPVLYGVSYLIWG